MLSAGNFSENPFAVQMDDPNRRCRRFSFEVDDLAAKIEGKEIIISPNSPSDGV